MVVVVPLTDRMGLEPHSDTVKMFIIDTIIDFDGHGYGDVMCKQTLMWSILNFKVSSAVTLFHS